jgi:AcrR family transcriptional regulator
MEYYLMNRKQPVKPERAYHSPARALQAEGTRRSIVVAARKLLVERGFDGTTIGAIAEAAGVATQTVYAALGSKSEVLREVLNLARFGPGYRELVKQALKENDPAERLRYSGRIARQIFEAERAEMELWRGAGAVSPEFAQSEREHEELRFTSQAPMIDLLIAEKQLKPGLDRTRAREILWAMTSRDLFRMLVVEREWSGDQYEAWLGETLVGALTDPRKR